MTKRQWSTDLPLGRQQFEGFFDPFKEPIGRWLVGMLREIDVVLDEIPPGRCPPVYPRHYRPRFLFAAMRARASCRIAVSRPELTQSLHPGDLRAVVPQVSLRLCASRHRG